jgi:hypothetical protein
MREMRDFAGVLPGRPLPHAAGHSAAFAAGAENQADYSALHKVTRVAFIA